MGCIALASATSARTIVSGANDFYAVSADLDRNGAYTVATAAGHPVTSLMGQASNVLRGGANFTSGISFNVIRSYASGTDYFMGLPGYISDVEAGYDCVYINDAGARTVEMIADGRRDIGFVIRWTIDRGPDHFLVEERLVARGDELTNAVAEITLTVTNLGPSTSTLGLRYAWHLALGNSGGAAAPTIGPRPPEVPVEPLAQLEESFQEPTFRSYIVSNEERPSTPGPFDDNPYVIEATVGSIPLDPPPTHPDQFLLTLFGHSILPVDPRTFGPLNTCFTYDIAEPPRPVHRASGTGVVYFWGETPDTALVALPGEPVSVTQYIFAYVEFPLVCDAGAPQSVECLGETTEVELDGSASMNMVDLEIEYLWTSDDPTVAIENETNERPVARISGLGPHEINLLVHRGGFAASCATEVEIVDTTPPVVRAVDAEPTSLWPPNHRLVPVEVTFDAWDLCDENVSIRLVGATSSEPDEVRRGGDGHTSEDIQGADLGTADFSVLLRAERQGGRYGRTYTLLYEVRDASGNTTTVPVTVSVAHDQRPSRRR